MARTIYRVGSQPEIFRKPARMPDGFVAINKDGFIIGAYKIPFKIDQNLFDYVTSRCATAILKKAMAEASETIPSDIEINFHLPREKIRCFCRIFKSDIQYLIGGWRLPENIVKFPNKNTAA